MILQALTEYYQSLVQAVSLIEDVILSSSLGRLDF